MTTTIAGIEVRVDAKGRVRVKARSYWRLLMPGEYFRAGDEFTYASGVNCWHPQWRYIGMPHCEIFLTHRRRVTKETR